MEEFRLRKAEETAARVAPTETRDEMERK